jgi:hypothetical protein
MRKRVTTIAFRSLRAPAAVESGARISLPPNSQQTGRFSFANHCQTDQTFRVTAQPRRIGCASNPPPSTPARMPPLTFA